MHVIRARPDNPETSLAAKLYLTLVFSSRNDSHLAAFPFQVGMCLRSPEPPSAAILLLQWVQVPMPPSLRGRSIKLKVPLSRERVRLAETNRIRLQIEQLRYHCECIDPLDDTRDARWMSLMSISMRHAVLIRKIT